MKKWRVLHIFEKSSSVVVGGELTFSSKGLAKKSRKLNASSLFVREMCSMSFSEKIRKRDVNGVAPESLSATLEYMSRILDRTSLESKHLSNSKEILFVV